MRYGEKKSYNDVYQFKKIWDVFGHWHKLHSNKILAGEHSILKTEIRNPREGIWEIKILKNLIYQIKVH